MEEVIVKIEVTETVTHKYEYKINMNDLREEANLYGCEAEEALNEIQHKLDGSSDGVHDWDIFPYCENYAEEISHEETCDERVIQKYTVKKGEDK